MKEGKGAFLVTLWWLLGCLCLGVLLVVLAPKEARPSAEENRMLAGAPQWSREAFFSGEYFSGIEDYLSDGFFNREDVIDFTDNLLGAFDMRTEEQRLIAEEAEINQLLTADAGSENSLPAAAPTAEPSPEPTIEPTTASTPEPTPEPTNEPTPEPTSEPTNESTPEPTPEPTNASTPEPTPEPTNEPTPEPTPEPTNEPTPEPTVEPTEGPTIEPTAEPTVEPSPAAATPSVPYATITPAPTQTPKVITPLEEGASYALYMIRDENHKDANYTYPAENIMTFAGSLNHLKTLLPVDGEIHYMQVPVAAVGVRLCLNRSSYIGWESTMEDALQSQVENNIYIHNIPAVLNDHLVAKEKDLYFFSDHHWTAKGAWYALEAVMQARGLPVVGYDEYQYQRKLMDDNGSSPDDWIEALYPLTPVSGVIISRKTEERESMLFNYRSSNYRAFLGGTQTPWRRFDTGYGTDRKALVICDSFGNAFVPYLLPYYDEVHMTDLRGSYFDPAEAGGTFSELVRYHQIDDIYIVLSTSNGINSPNSLEVFRRTITQ